jgi:hypothetical protein
MTMASMQRWALWVVSTLGSVAVSYLVWWFWGSAFCGEEFSDTPPGSTGDALCQALVDPVWPWALVSAIPTILALLGGCLGLVLRRPRLYRFSLVAPVAIGVLSFFLPPALF